MSVTIDLWAAVGGLAVLAGGIAWLVNLHGKQEAHEDLCAERYKQIAENHQALDAKVDKMDAKMDRLMAAVVRTREHDIFGRETERD